MINTIITFLKKYRVYWISMFILFSIFSVIILRSIDNANMERLTEKIEEANSKAKLRELNAMKKSDSAIVESKKTTSRVSMLEKQLSDQNKILIRIDANYSKSMKELINLKDEKIYIPNNVSTNEQFEFITNYKYSEY